jgi:hypothetical protein
MISAKRRRVVRLVVLAAATACLLICAVCVPIAMQAAREMAHRDQVLKNLQQIKAALNNHENQASGGASSAADAAKLAFVAYSGYFVSNQFEPNAAESFAIISDQGQFDRIFGVAMVMQDKSHRLPADAFASNLVLAVVKRGSAVWEYQVESVAVDGGVVDLRYRTTSKKSDTATFACPLIVSVPRGKYTAAVFVENGEPVKKVPIAGEQASGA